MKLFFEPNQEVHSRQVRFPICFVVSERLSTADEILFSAIPQVMVYDNTCIEQPLSVYVNFEVKPPINGCLQVKCKADQSGVVEQAIQAALVEFKRDFADYVVEVKFEITPLTREEVAEIEDHRQRLGEIGWI